MGRAACEHCDRLQTVDISQTDISEILGALSHPQATARGRTQGPFAVKSKVAKPAEYPQGRGTEQGMIDAIQSRLHTPQPPEAGLLSIAAARSAATVATNPQIVKTRKRVRPFCESRS